ncbi:MAG: hypothetical protein Q9220_004091 [cf. Caloplaca sp. 1 TL-2023]
MEPLVLYRVIYGTTTPTEFQMSLLHIRPAILHEYCRHKVRHRDYPAIIPSIQDCVRATYVQGLTDGDMYRLDIFEGEEYQRRKVRARILDVEGDEDGHGNVEGEEVQADTYVWVAGEDQLEKGEWDFADFRRTKLENWVDRRDEYDVTEVDEAVRIQGNDPTGGRGFNGMITEKLLNKQEDVLIKSAV